MSVEGVNSIQEARRLYNNPDTPKEDKRQLLVKFPELLKSSADTTEYQISDEDKAEAYERGKENAKDSVGYDGGKTGAAVIDAGMVGVQAGASATLAATTGLKGTVNLNTSTATDFSKVCAYVAAAFCIATAAKYVAQRPNKKQVDATQKLMNDELPEGQNLLNESQRDIESASESIVNLTEEAEEANEEGQDKIETDKTLFDFYRQRYNALKTKAQSGEGLTPEEKNEMKNLAPILEDLGEGITTTTEETSETVAGLNEEIGSYQDTFDGAAEIMEEVNGLTDYAENFDGNTRTMCYVEGVSQAINAATGYWTAAKLMAGPFWQWILAAATGVAAGISTGAATEQFKWAKKVGNEIETREITQDLNDVTQELHSTELENMADAIEYIEEDVVIEVPEDLEVPEQVPAGTAIFAMGNEEVNPFGNTKTEDNKESNNKKDDNKKKTDDVR